MFLLRQVGALGVDFLEVHLAQPIPVIEDLDKHALGERDVGAFADVSVQAHVHRRPRVEVAEHAIHLRDDGLKLVELFRRHAFAGASRAHEFQRLEQVEDLLHQIGLDRRDRRADVRFDLDEAVGLKLLQRFSNGDGADPELGRHLVDDKFLTGAILAVDDAAPDRIQDGFLLAPEKWTRGQQCGGRGRQYGHRIYPISSRIDLSRGDHGGHGGCGLHGKTRPGLPRLSTRDLMWNAGKQRGIWERGHLARAPICASLTQTFNANAAASAAGITAPIARASARPVSLSRARARASFSSNSTWSLPPAVGPG